MRFHQGLCALPLLVLLLVSSVPAWAQEATEDGFVALSDGPGLAGWRAIGAQSWGWQEGAIHCSGQGSGWLCSERVYEDFALRLEFRIAQGGNSGVYLRAPLVGRQSATGIEVQIRGLQAGQPDYGTTGGLYEIVGPPAEAGRPAGEWNEMEVTFVGQHLTVRLNRQLLHDVDLTDAGLNAVLLPGQKPAERMPRGFIGLQNHGSEVWFRSVRVREEPEGGFSSLFTGTLGEWRVLGDAVWRVEGDTIIGEGAAESYLATPNEYGDYALRLQYRVEAGARGGVCTRGTEGDKRIEVCLADDAGSPPSAEGSGALRGNGVPCMNVSLPAGEWNDLEIVRVGHLLDVRLNAVPVLSGSVFRYGGYFRPPEKGWIGLRHGTGRIDFRGIRVKRVSEGEAAER